MSNIPRLSEEELLEDMERDLKEEESKSRKKKTIILGGALAGAAIAFYFYTVNQQATAPGPAKPSAKQVQARKAAKQDKPAPAPETKEQENASQPSASQEAGLDPETVDERLAALSQKNLIKEDIDASMPAKAPPKNEDEKVVVLPPPEVEVEKEEAPAAEPAPKVEKPPVKEPAPKRVEVKAAPAEQPQPPAPAPAQKPSGEFAVQLLSTTDAVKALEIRDKLSSNGYEPWIALSSAKEVIYRVEVGVFGSIKEASSLSAKLAGAGLKNRPAYLSGGGRVTLVLGSFSSAETANKMVKTALAKGFTAKNSRRDEVKKLYMVRVGKFHSEQEAHDAMVAMRKRGFNPTGISK